MFQALRSAVSGWVNTIKTAIGGKPAPAPKQPKLPAKIAPIPVLSTAPIAKWGQSAQSIQQQTAAWKASPAYKAQSNWQNNNAVEQAKRAAAAAAAAEAARKEAARRQAQAALDARFSFMRQAAGAAVAKAKNAVGSWFKPKTTTVQSGGHDGFATKEEAESFKKWYAQQTPEKQAEVDRYNKIKNEYADSARKMVDKKKQASGWFGLGSSQSARNFADERGQELSSDKYLKQYNDRLDAHNKMQAKLQADFEAKKLKLSEADANALADKYNKQLQDSVDSLEYTRAAYDGLVSGYGAKSSEKLTDPASRLGGWFNKNVRDGVPGKIAGGIFNYTIGQGSQNVPSLVTAPSRLVNTVGNWSGLTQNRNYHQGKTDNSKVTSLSDAWTKSFQQRNLNFAQPKQQSKDQFLTAMYDKLAIKESGRSKDQWYKAKQKDLDRMWSDANRQSKESNYVLEATADPLMAAGKLGKAAKALPLTKAAQSSSWLSKASGAVSKLKETKPLKWALSDHKNYASRKNEFVQQELDDIYQKKPQIRKLITQWQENKGNIKAAEKVKFSNAVIEDFAGLDKFQVAAFQQFVRSGKDWGAIKNAERFSKGERANIEKLADKWGSNFKTLRDKELKHGIQTPERFGYLPQYRRKFSLTSVIKGRKGKDGGDPWFIKEQKAGMQSKKDLIKSMSARQYSSTAARQDFPVLRDIIGGRKDIAENINRIDDVEKYVKRTKWEKGMQVAGAPIRAWKKAVLLGNPAWYVNNELFNQMQGISAGGLKFLKNQRGTGKYLKHIESNAKGRLRPSEAQKMVRDVGTSINKEVGAGKLATLATKQENRARVALYRTFRQKGMSHAEATKKVNDNLFDYSTKNWERPIKSVMPFYSWNKGLAKAAVKMPLQKPKTALVFNKLDRYQGTQFDVEFDKVVPDLEKLGYTKEEIEKIRADQAKYFKGRLKIGDKWTTTPFNAFSEKGMSNLGFNPFFSAVGEAGTATDNFNQPLKGKDAGLGRRIMSKFPQPELARKSLAAFDVASGKKKPSFGWIGKAGSEGYGLTKEKQGYDKTKPNYVRNLDPTANIKTDLLKFVGVPRLLEFDKGKLIETKKMQKVVGDYFSINTKDMDFEAANKARQAVFNKYGVTEDEFYKGVLAKYDSETTKGVKKQKEEAAAKNKSLFEEYAAQPQGTRNIWATNKLRQLVADGYFNDNPFLKSFKWINGDSAAKADRQVAYQDAKRTGNWTKWQATYGDTRKKSEKKLAYDKAKASGDWSAYRKTYGTKTTPYKIGDKYFKSAESMQKYKDGAFWKRYASASKTERKVLLADNPEYNKRQGWTQAQWDEDRIKRKQAERSKLNGWGSFASLQSAYAAKNAQGAAPFLRKRAGSKAPKVAWRLSA